MLFLDELPEFQRQVLEVLREPLESGRIAISRATAQVVFPARFQLIAAMNPCPCGFLGSERCRCSSDQVQRYRQKISGPLLDRFDLHVAVNTIPTRTLHEKSEGPSNQQIREKVIQLHKQQWQRQGKNNAHLSGKELAQIDPLSSSQQLLLEQAIDRLGLSARAYHRILRVARTIADFENHSHIQDEDLQEALTYRQLDRQRKPLTRAPAL